MLKKMNKKWVEKLGFYPFFITLLHNGISIPPKLLPSIITNRYNNVFKLQVDDTEKYYS